MKKKGTTVLAMFYPFNQLCFPRNVPEGINQTTENTRKEHGLLSKLKVVYQIINQSYLFTEFADCTENKNLALFWVEILYFKDINAFSRIPKYLRKFLPTLRSGREQNWS